MLNAIRSVLLIIGIYAIAYAVSTDSPQFFWAFIGGVAVGASVSLGDLE